MTYSHTWSQRQWKTMAGPRARAGLIAVPVNCDPATGSSLSVTSTSKHARSGRYTYRRQRLGKFRSHQPLKHTDIDVKAEQVVARVKHCSNAALGWIHQNLISCKTTGSVCVAILDTQGTSCFERLLGIRSGQMQAQVWVVGGPTRKDHGKQGQPHSKGAHDSK